MRTIGWVWGAVAFFLGACGGGNDSATKYVGDACTPGDEAQPGFFGFGADEVSVEGVNPDCGRGVCLINHFQGRVSCPYGQADPADPQCFLANGITPVSVPISPQLTNRRAELAVTCSCRCDGPDEGPFCTCPSGSKCTSIVPDIGFPEGKSIAGSYCVAPEAVYDGIFGPEWDRSIENCGPP
jgi:hypothetical protein